MQRAAGNTPTQNATPFFSSSTFFGGGSNSNLSSSSNSRSRPGTSSGDPGAQQQPASDQPPPQRNVLTKDRKGSFSRKSSFSSPGKKSRSNSSAANAGPGAAGLSGGRPGITIITDNSIPPALPDFALAAAAKLSRDTEVLQSPASTESFSKMLSRTAPTPVNGYSASSLGPSAIGGAQTESSMVHQHIQEMANKRISTLDYLRKA